MGWQRWRRQLLEQTRDQVIVFAQRWYGIFHLAEFALLVGVKLKDAPPGIGTLQEVLAKYSLTVIELTLPLKILGLCRGDGFSMDTIAQSFNPPRESIDEVVLPLLIKVMGP